VEKKNETSSCFLCKKDSGKEHLCKRCWLIDKLFGFVILFTAFFVGCFASSTPSWIGGLVGIFAIFSFSFLRITYSNFKYTEEELKEKYGNNLYKKYKFPSKLFFLGVGFILLLIMSLFFAPNPFASLWMGIVAGVTVFFVGGLLLVIPIYIDRMKN